MRTNEWREAIRQSLYFILFLAGMHLFMALMGLVIPDNALTTDRVVAFNAISLAMFVLLCGLGTFASERSQNAMEYTLALPVTRRQLLREKFMPRLTAVLLFIFLFWVLLAILGQLPGPTDVVFLTLLLLHLFLVSFALSLGAKNFVALFFTAVLCFLLLSLAAFAAILIGFQLKTHELSGYPLQEIFKGAIWPLSLASYMPELSRGQLAVLLPLIIILIPLPLALRLSFPRFDPRPRSGFNRRFSLLAGALTVPTLILATLLSYIIWKAPGFYGSFFLTDDLRLIEVGESPVVVYDRTGVWKPDIPFQWADRQLSGINDGWIYMAGYSSAGMQYVRLNPATHRVEELHSLPHSFIPSLVGSKGHVYLLENEPHNARANYSPSIRYGALRLVDIDLSTKEKKVLHFADPVLGGHWEPRIIFTSTLAGKRFWILHSGNLLHTQTLRLWQDGRAEVLASPDPGSIIRQILFMGERVICTTDQGLHVGRLTENGFASAARLAGNFFHVGMLNWGKEVQLGDKTVFAVKSTTSSRTSPAYLTAHIIAIDLDTLTIDDFGKGLSPFNQTVSGNEAWFVRQQESQGEYVEQTIFHYSGGKLSEIGHLPACKIMDVSSAGVVARLGNGKIVVYAFPDLRPLTFPGLN